MTPQLERLTINALWTPLKNRDWRGARSTRDLNDYGDRPPMRAIARGRIPQAPSMSTRIRQASTPAGAIAARIHPDTRNALPAPHHVVLFRERYANALATTSQATREDLALALHPPHDVPNPYAWQADGDGRQHLIRIYDPFLTPRVYGFLHDLAALAIVWAETDEPPELITQAEEPMSSRPELASSTTACTIDAHVLQSH